MITPLLRQLHQRFPAATIDVVCEGIGRQLLEHNPHVHDVLTLGRGATLPNFLRLAGALRRRRYALVIDCQALPKTGLLSLASGATRRAGFGGRWWRSLCYNGLYNRSNADYSALDKLKLFEQGSGTSAGLDLEDLALDFPTGVESVKAAQHFCDTHFSGLASLPPMVDGGSRRWKTAALFGVSRRGYKVWPPEKLAEVGRWLAGRGLQPFIVHGPGEEKAAGELADMIGPEALFSYDMPRFAELKEILARCALFIGNDGGPKHLAALSGIPTVALFGRVHPEAWTRPGDPFQQWVATASGSRALPTSGRCEQALTLEQIPASTVIRRVERLLDQMGID